MPEKKRKASSHDKRPSKKAKSDADAPLSISLLDTQDSLPPVLAVALGLDAPALPMTPYARSGASAVTPQSEMLLHSSGHPRLDFVANKDFANSSDGLMDHYVGIYDPASSSLRLVQANRLALRATLRPSAEQLASAAAKRGYQTATVLREALGMEFGNKKAKKQIATRADNAVIGNSSRADGKRDIASEALLESIAKTVASMPTVAAMNAAAEDQKPKPKADLSARRPDLVYPVESLIAPEVIQSINVQDWVDAVNNKTPPLLASRFVQNRLTDFVISRAVTRIKVLRYMLHVIGFFHALKSVGKSKRIPPKAELLSKMKAPEFLVEAIKKKFGREKYGSSDG
jgi:DNA-directed RNA polymerase I subunit RPA49